MQVLTTDNDSLEGSFDSDVSLRIGGRSPGNYRFIGAIDDVRIYNRCLTDSEVQLLYTDGLRSLAENPMDTRTPEQQGLLSTAYRPQDETLNALARELAAAELALDQARWNGTRKWYVNSQGQTFALLDADEFRMGSPETEDGHMEIEWFHRRRIGRRIAIATKEVTHQQWRMFSQATPQLGWKSDQEQLMATLLTDDSPISGMTWYEAAWYCNWLSEQEGIPRDQWCYETNDKGQYDSGMKPKQNFWQLTGYRLPTEAEWEYACRAGTSTSRYYGVSNVLLPFYAWYMANGADRTHPVARLKPNDFGLFDMQGNVYEWCFDPDYRRNVGFAEDETVPDMPSLEGINTTVHRMLRGGAFTTTAPNVRSAGRGANQPGNRNTYAGFRPARTYILSP
jgi:formylglycine-generating enzyme required for sulfatase activity